MKKSNSTTILYSSSVIQLEDWTEVNISISIYKQFGIIETDFMWYVY